MAKVLEDFYDVTTQTQYHEGDEYTGPDEKKKVLHEKGMVSMDLEGQSVESETFEEEPEGYQGYNYEGNYQDARNLARELDLEISLNSSHEDLVEAIEGAI